MYADDTSGTNSLKSCCDIEENIIPSKYVWLAEG